ncbi:MAG TPA: Ig-like domain-containing protein [Clostridia bacterium]|nr:Ig-like domain-containing protein [Clostridia bacterium]
MFEFFVSEGSESATISNNFCLSGAFYVDDNGTGLYKHPKAENVQITFNLNDGKVSVKQTGKLPVNVSGTYHFVNSYINVTEEAAIEILEQLPTAATSLNHNNGEYKLSLAQEMVDGWFYDVKANFVDTNALIAEFYIASDMSAVYRVDTDSSILIWGSAEPLLDATYPIDAESLLGTTSTASNSDTSNAITDKMELSANYVSVTLPNDAIAIENSAPITIKVPGALDYTFKCQSSNTKIAKVDNKGVITAVAHGEAVITVTVMIDGAQRPFALAIHTFANERTAS